MLQKSTKIITTVSDRRCGVDFIRSLFEAGMNVVRMNSAHLGEEGITSIVRNCREVSPRIGIMIDTKGPEIRTTTNEDPEGKLAFREGMLVQFSGNTTGRTSLRIINLNYPDIARDVRPGQHILIDDGELDFEILSVDSDSGLIAARCLNDGELGSRKSVNIPSSDIRLPALTDRDRATLAVAARLGVDFVAHSFVRSADDIHAVQAELDALGSDMKIIAKIENQQGVDNFDSILEASYGIMVARGDMGVEIPYEEVPVIQKKIIKKVYRTGKQVITATQMLESMIKNPRPTRAETTDVANAVYDGTSAIMLSGETAAGSYPVEAVKTMVRIAERTEQDVDYRKRFYQSARETDTDITNAICHASCTTALDLNAKAIVTVTKSGTSARMLAKYRPESDIISCATTEKVCRQLSLTWGVTPIVIKEEKEVFNLFDKAIQAAVKMKLLQTGDLTVITSGVPIGVSGTTNMMKVQIV